MKKGIFSFVLAASLVVTPCVSFGWGKTGHELVGKIAWYFLDDSTRKLVKNYLGMSFEDAANWMDDSRSNSYYNYMRTWHYLDIDKGEKYDAASTERNIITVMHSAIVKLRDYKNSKKKDIRYELLLIFHLVGDLHQPLHTGYAVDKGGNTIEISSPIVSGNLHSIWDSQIIDVKGINFDSCMSKLSLFDSVQLAETRKINELKWMYQSRSFLDQVYDFKDNTLSQEYVDKSAEIIKKQILIAGMRLASILKQTFNPGTPA